MCGWRWVHGAYGYQRNLAAACRASFPWATLLINVLGSAVIGWYSALSAPGAPLAGAPEARIFVMVGLCDGFTTFSSFSLQTFELLQRGEGMRAGAYVLASVLLCLLGVWLGRA